MQVLILVGMGRLPDGMGRRRAVYRLVWPCMNLSSHGNQEADEAFWPSLKQMLIMRLPDVMEGDLLRKLAKQARLCWCPSLQEVYMFAAGDVCTVMVRSLQAARAGRFSGERLADHQLVLVL